MKAAAWILAMVLLAPAACASEASPTAEELLAALNYDPKKASKPAAAAQKAPKKLSTLKSTEASRSPAKSDEKKKETIVEKKLKGNLVFIRANRMAVELASGEQGSEEINLTVDPKVKLKKAKKIGDLGYGDVVDVKYMETSSVPEKPDQIPAVLRMSAVEITLVKKANPEALVA